MADSAAAPAPANAPAPSAGPLLRHARRLLWWTLLPLLALVLLLAAWQATTQWQRLLDGAAAEVGLQRFGFESIARDVENHVQDLRRVMQQEFLRADGGIDPAVRDALQRHSDPRGAPDGWSLDSLPVLLRPGMAQLMWPQTADAAPPPPAVLRRAQVLAATIEVAHQRNPDLLWSYFFAEPQRHIVLFPWVPTRDVVTVQAAPSLTVAMARWYGNEVFAAASPQRNPARQPTWTAPWADAAGQGLVVSHVAPVVVADAWRGVVGTDIRLSTFDPLMQRLPARPWRAWLIDDRGHVLADRQPASAPATPASAASTALPMLPERLPAGVDAALIRAAAARPGTALDAGAQRVIALDVAGAPWTVVLVAPERELLRVLLPQVLPYTLIALGLLAIWVLGQALLRTRVVGPMVSLFDYLQRLSADPAAPAPALAPRWQPWVQMVGDVFTRLRSAARGERREQALKSAIVDHSQNAVVVADAEDRIVEFNPAAQAMLGWTREQVIGRPVRDVMAPERFRDSYIRATRRMRDGDPDHLLGQRLERVALRADGSELPVEVVMWRTRVDDEEFFTASLSDLSARRAAAELIERQRDALRQSEKLTAMGSLLAGVAHELNNPLAVVMGRASLLEDKAAGTSMAGDAQKIREAAERCGRIVRTFLNMARNKPMQRVPVPLNDLVRAAADMLGYTLRSHGITIELQLDPALPAVNADADQIGQVLLNLIVNAQQVLAALPPPRRIVISSGVDGRSAFLAVADNGPGVPAALRERIFDPFFTTKAEGSGTGLGLAVSRAIVREHGGELLLLPEAAQRGAQFCVRLPLSPAPAAAEPADAAPR